MVQWLLLMMLPSQPLPHKRRSYYFQPIIDNRNNSVAFYEMLTRIDGNGSIEKYLNSLEDERVQALHDLLGIKAAITFLDLYGLNFSMSVNLSPITIAEYGKTHLYPMLRTCKHPNKIIIEFTERYFKENFKAIAEFTIFARKHGIKVAIDDWSASPLEATYENILEIYPDFIKIDIDVAMEGGAYFDVVMALAKSYNIHVVVERVESHVQMELASTVGANFIQGWLYSPALPLAAVVYGNPKEYVAGQKKYPAHPKMAGYSF